MYKIFNNINDFYDWQGTNGSPSDGTVNKELGFSTNNISGTFRYTYPTPYPSALFELDQYGMPINIRGSNIKVCAFIDCNCPEGLVPEDLKTLEDVKLLGWFPDIEEEGV